MGGMKGMMGMIPGFGKLSKQIDSSKIDDNILGKQIALISSMTKKNELIHKFFKQVEKRELLLVQAKMFLI